MRVSVALGIVALLPAAALARSGGISGHSQSGCSGCHGGGSTPTPTVTISGPSTVASGSKTQYTLVIADSSQSGCAGLDVSASGATLTAGGPTERLLSGEVVNSSTGSFSGSPMNYTFTVNAGSSSFTLFAAGLAGCDQTNSADSETSLAVTIQSAGPPTVATPASASPSTVTGKTTQLSVLGADAAGESTLTYTWSSSPSGVSFSPNGTNGAKSATATFGAAGNYTLTATIKDPSNQTVTSSTNITVTSTPASISISPRNVTLGPSATQGFSVSAVDQFGAGSSPPAVAWSASGDGSIGTGGLFTAGSQAGSATVSVSGGGLADSTSVTVSTGASNPPTVATPSAASPSSVSGKTTQVSVLGADTTGGESTLTYTWSGTGPGAVSFSPNGSNGAKASTATFSSAGTYTLTASISNPANQSVTSAATVSVTATATSVAISPANPSLAPSSTQSFTGQLVDQFGAPVGGNPTIAWTASGDGAIGSGGLFTAGASAGTATVNASTGSVSGSTSVTISNSSGSPPTVVTPATPATASVSGISTTVSVLGADASGGEAGLTYTWSAQSASGIGSVTFSPNATNAAKNSTATFTMAGSYTLTATIANAGGQQVTNSATVTVISVPTGLGVTPASATVDILRTQAFVAAIVDQFGIPTASAPSVAWSAVGDGTIDSSGSFTAGPQAGSANVTATSGAMNSTAVVTVLLDTAPPQVVLTEPANGAVLSGNTYLHADVADPDGVAWVAFQLDGANLTHFSGGPYDYALDTRGYSSGPHTITAQASDNVGNVGTFTVEVTFSDAQQAQQQRGCTGAPGDLAVVALLAGLASVARRRRV